MTLHELPHPDARGRVSRRTLLKQLAACTAVHSGVLHALADTTPGRRRLAFVGTYSSGGGDSGANGKGIYLYEMDPISGALTLVQLAAASRNPSWLALDPSGRYLYAGNEVTDFEGSSGSVSAFAVNREKGTLQPLNVVSSAGAGPAHLSIDGSGKYVLVANYAGGSIAVLPILSTGALGRAVYVHQDAGSVGPVHAASAPPGSFANSGHLAPHAHMIHADPQNHFVLYTDLGQDRLYVSAFDQATGLLSPVTSQPFVTVPPGDGPRHFIFHRNGRWLYLLQEESSTVMFFTFDPATGALRPQQTISTLPGGFQGTSYTAEILFSPDGRFLYVSNRLHDTIAILSLDSRGRLQFVGETSTLGDYPRYIAFSPDGTFLYTCNQRSDNIASFHVNRKTGGLTFTGKYTAVGSPSCIVFLS